MEPCLLSQVPAGEFNKKITPEERSAFWEYSKSLGANKGVPHETIIAQMADKFNLPRRLMAQALDGPKSIRKASEEVRARQKMSQRFLAENSRYLEDLDKTGVQRLLNMVGSGTYKSTLAFHGPVPPVVHAIDVLTTNPIEFFKAYARGLQSITDAGRNRIMDDLQDPKTHPYYKTFLDAGAPIGNETVEGFKGTGWASRSMDAALKPLRYKLMENRWLKAPPEERTPEYARHLAQQYAHATGALVKGELMDNITRGFRKILLAPQLTPSKIAKALFDPLTTANTYSRMVQSKFSDKVRPATWAERKIANDRTWRAARFFGATMGALAINEAMLRATGSNQKVNYYDPKRSDFMAFKGFGHSWRSRGALEIMDLVAKIAALKMQHQKFGAESPEEAVAKYSEFKLAPGIGLGTELATGKDIFGRPAPWSSDPGGKVFPRKNWIEFAGEHSPIFLGHGVYAFHEALRDQGVDTRESRNVIHAIASNPKAIGEALKEATMATGLEFFGINVQPDRYIGR